MDLKSIGLVCLDMYLHCQKTDNVANIVQSGAFEPLMLEA